MAKVYFLFSLFIVFAFFLSTQTQIVISKTNPGPVMSPVINTQPEKPTLGAYTTGDATIDGYIIESCARYDIDPLLILAQMKQESGFKKKAVSHKGASGLMQLMPATAMRFGVKNIYDPAQNIDAGVKYMRWLLNKFDGDVQLALAGYNAGEGAVMKYGYQIPPYRETQNYVAKITTHYLQIKTPDLVRGVLGEEAIREMAKSL